MELNLAIQDLAYILITAGAVSILFRILKWPQTVSYLVAGILLSPSLGLTSKVFGNQSFIETSQLEIWAELGVIFLLFGLGLEFSFKKLLQTGNSSLLTGAIEVFCLFLCGLFVSSLLGFQEQESYFLAAALSISSSSIVIRSLKERKMNQPQLTQHIYGVLVVEDLLAVILLVVLGAFAQSQNLQGLALTVTLLKIFFFASLWFTVGTYMIPWVLRRVRSHMNAESLFLVAIALCLMMVLTSTHVGLSAALGAFMMGSFLGSTPEGKLIHDKLQPLQDLFAAIFFVSIGMLANTAVIGSHGWVLLGLVAFVVAGKLVFCSFASVVSGQGLSQSLITGVGLSQIGEFSFLIAKLGLSYGLLSKEFLPLIVMTSILTSSLTNPFLKWAAPLSGWFEKNLSQKFLIRLKNYQEQFHESSAVKGKKFFSYFISTRLVINGIIVFGIGLLSKKVLQPFLFSLGVLNTQIAQIICLILTSLLTLPFLSAIIFDLQGIKSDVKYHNQKILNRVVFIFRIFVATALFIIVIQQFMSIGSSLAMLAAALFAIYLLRNHLQTNYLKIEQQFLKNLNESEIEEIKLKMKPQLAPWDVQLDPVVVSPECELIGKTLIEAKIKEEWGVTVTLIERGHQKILAPKREERIYPLDRLYILGQAENIQKFTAMIEYKSDDKISDTEEYGLDSILITKSDPWCEQEIRATALREKLDSLIVAIERDGHRTLAPDPSFRLRAQDKVWLVGSKKKIRDYRWSQS